MPIITAVSSPTTALITSTSDASGNISFVTANTTAMTLDTNQNATYTGSVSAPNTFGYKNRLINGAMGIWQRGTTFSGINNTPTYGADRWAAFAVGTGKNQIQLIQSTSVPAGYKYSLQFGRPASSANTYQQYVCQAIESTNMIDLQGQTVTLSFWAKTGANYSGGALTIQISTGTGVDESVSTLSAGPFTGYTGNTQPINTTQAITTTWTRYSFTGTIPSNATEMAVGIAWTPSGTAGSDDNIYITGVQLEKGSLATPFDYRDYGRELIMCQRYFVKLTGYSSIIGSRYGTSKVYGSYYLPVTMRATPSLSNSGNWYVVNTTASDTDAAPTLFSIVSGGVVGNNVDCVWSTAFNPASYIYYITNNTIYSLSFAAEL